MSYCEDKPCDEAVLCCKCNRKLCHGHKGASHTKIIEGHFVFNDQVFCTDCWSREHGSQLFKR